MKYTTAVLLALTAGVFAVPQDASSITSAPSSTATPELTPQVSCINNCEPGDVTCQASCVGAARPNSAQVVDTTKCAEKCDQGDGSPEDTDKYSKCVQGCIASHFPSSQTVAVGNGASASGAAATSGGSSNPTASSGGSASGSGASATGTGANADSTGAASANGAHIAGAGLAGLLAIFAL